MDNQVLQQLANDLHVSVAVLWGALVAQARIAAWANAVYSAFGFGAGIFGAWLVRRGLNATPTGPRPNYGEPGRHDFDKKLETSYWLRGGGIVALGVGFFVFTQAGYWALTAWLNPQYWALCKLLERIQR